MRLKDYGRNHKKRKEYINQSCLRVRRDSGSNLPKGFDDHEENDGSDGRLDDGAD
jgi:hypothetical protein